MADRYLSISFAQNTGYMSHYSQVIFREVFWHEYDKIPRHTGQMCIRDRYEKEEIILLTFQGKLRIQGKRLKIPMYTPEEMYIEGVITEIILEG